MFQLGGREQTLDSLAEHNGGAARSNWDRRRSSRAMRLMSAFLGFEWLQRVFFATIGEPAARGQQPS